jgi:hypothetical protein
MNRVHRLDEPREIRLNPTTFPERRTRRTARRTVDAAGADLLADRQQIIVKFSALKHETPPHDEPSHRDASPAQILARRREHYHNNDDAIVAP